MPDKIDPNDLSSIDALLDEAELDSGVDLQEDVIAEEVELSEIAIEDLDEITDFDELEPEVEIGEGIVAEEESSNLEPEPEPVIADKKADDVLEKRADSRRKKSKKEPAEAEMKEIKKLIIIFSSVIIGLAVIGLGIGLWGALSSGGLDEESFEKIENIESGVTEGILKSSESNKTIKELEKKLDGLSFLIKQLDTDILAMTSGDNVKTLLNLAEDSNKKVEDNSKIVKSETNKKPLKTETSASVALVNLNPEMMKKMDKVSSQMSNTQRRIYEVNKRVKSLQSQYKKLLRSIKSVEKEMLKSRVATSIKPASKLKEEHLHENDDSESTQKGGMYQYTAPGGMFDSSSEYYR